MSRIAVIGIGSLGSFVAQAISELENLQKLVLVDFDIVEERNLVNSIYRKGDVGRYKTTSLHNIIREQNQHDIEINIITEKYVEGITRLPDVDLTIDCRDFMCDRGSEIDVRLFITSRYLVIDCRKNVSYDRQYEGRYLTKLTKNDLRKSSLIIISFIQDGFLNYMILNKIIKEVDIDYLHKISNDIRYQNEDKNMIIDYDISKKLLNLENNIDKIIQENKTKDVVITLGDKRMSPLMKTIPKNTINRPIDVISTMIEMTNTPCTSQYYYIVSTSNNNNVCNVELLPEMGSA